MIKFLVICNCLFIFIWGQKNFLPLAQSQESHHQELSSCEDNDSDDGHEEEASVIFEKEMNFIPNFDHLKIYGGMQIATDLQNRATFSHSQFASQELFDYLTKNDKKLNIISARVMTVIPGRAPIFFSRLISNDTILKMLFKKDKLKKIDKNRITIEKEIKLHSLLLNVEKILELEIEHNRYYSVNGIPSHIKHIVDIEKNLLNLGAPKFIIELNIKGNEVMDQAKFLFFFYYTKDNDGLIVAHKYIGVEKAFSRYIPSYLFKKISQFVVNKFAPKYVKQIRRIPKLF